MAIFQFLKTAAAAMLDFKILEILTGGMMKRVKLRQLAKCRGERSNQCGDMVIFQLLKMAAAAILHL